MIIFAQRKVIGEEMNGLPPVLNRKPPVLTVNATEKNSWESLEIKNAPFWTEYHPFLGKDIQAWPEYNPKMNKILPDIN